MDSEPGNDLVPITDWSNLLTVFKKGDLPMPFSQEILLFESHVAGTGYVQEIQQFADQLAARGGYPPALPRTGQPPRWPCHQGA